MFKTLNDVDVAGKNVIVRGDLNVPMKDGAITDNTRITRLIPTIKEILDKDGRVILISHFGRPKGKKEPSMSLAPVAQALSDALGKPVKFVSDCISDTAHQAVSAMTDGDIILLENLRFHEEEESNDNSFAEEIASLGDIYVNDAFSAAHRAHASTHGVTKFLPAYAGRLMEAELNALNAALENPERPVVALVGGAKISTKLDLLNNLVQKIDVLVLGGGMANTFLYAQGKDVGKSLCEQEMKDQAITIMKTAEKHGCKILLPVDGVVAAEFKENAEHETVNTNSLPADKMMLDIGDATTKEIEQALLSAKTLLWNGPMGAFETKPFDSGTNAVAKVVAKLTSEGKLVSVAGGGDTVAALASAGITQQMTYVSTAGGAFLEWLEGKELPGVQALTAAA